MDVRIFQKYQEDMDKIPKRVVPKEKVDYKYLLGECDAYIRQLGGRIRGEVDYQKWQATIDLYLEHFEFCDREALTLLKGDRREGGECYIFDEKWVALDVGVHWIF